MVVREDSERHADGGNDGDYSGDIQSLANQVKRATQSGHCKYKGEHLAEYRHPSDRAISAATVHAIFLSHPHDALCEARDDGIKGRQFFGFWKRSNPQLAGVCDDRAVSASLKLVLLTVLQFAFAPTSLRQARLRRRTEAAVVGWRR